MYGIENLHKYWLFYGEYYLGKISHRPKRFSFFIDASKYDPEQLLFQIRRCYLNFQTKDGNIVVSPDALMNNPKEWLLRSFTSIFQQYHWETSKQNVIISNSSTLMANRNIFKPESIFISRCGINFLKIQRRALKKLTPYPEAIDIE